MKYLVMTLPDGSKWGVPIDAIARNRAEYYANEFKNVEESLEKDTLPLFETSPDEIADWATNNMNWSDFKGLHVLFAPSKPITPEDFEEAWVNAEKKLEERAN